MMEENETMGNEMKDISRHTERDCYYGRSKTVIWSLLNCSKRKFVITFGSVIENFS